jgi:hypothetical protein
MEWKERGTGELTTTTTMRERHLFIIGMDWPINEWHREWHTQQRNGEAIHFREKVATLGEGKLV